MEAGGGFSAEDLSTIGGIATVSLLHSFIPTHWLPFSIVGRAQKWTLSRTLLVIPSGLVDESEDCERFSVSSLGVRSPWTLIDEINLIEGITGLMQSIKLNIALDLVPAPDLVMAMKIIDIEVSRLAILINKDRVSLFSLFVLLYAAAFGAVLHVISTSLLGITAITITHTIAGEETVHKLASLLLVVLGGSYVILFLTGKGGHSHSHNQPMEKMAVAGLVLVPALSPCATTLPVFLAVGNSSYMMVLAIIVLLFSTITVMTSLVALSFYGASQLKFHWVERYDKLLVGSVLCLVGILTLIFHDHDHDGDAGSTGEHLHRKIISL
ncbi:hypothetical protein LguiA_012586 [Lonicera macranthoides]